MWPKVSVTLIKKQFLFLQEIFHASNSFWKIYPLNNHIVPMASTKLQLNPTYGLRDEIMKKIQMAAI